MKTEPEREHEDRRPIRVRDNVFFLHSLAACEEEDTSMLIVIGATHPVHLKQFVVIQKKDKKIKLF
jgi:hypothetical protein